MRSMDGGQNMGLFKALGQRRPPMMAAPVQFGQMPQFAPQSERPMPTWEQTKQNWGMGGSTVAAPSAPVSPGPESLGMQTSGDIIGEMGAMGSNAIGAKAGIGSIFGA